MRNPLFSCIVPVVNEASVIGQLLDSIRMQDYRPIEVIVVDGGSTDGTQDMVSEYAKKAGDSKFAVKLFRETGALRSLPNARNIGIEKSGGEYLMFLDADFLFIEKDSVSKIKKRLDTTRFTGVRVKPLGDTELERQIGMTYPKTALSCYRRSVFGALRFNPDLGYGEDHYIMFKAGISLNSVCNTTIARHFPHDGVQLRKQMVWYGRTILRYISATFTPRNPLLMRDIAFLLHNASYMALSALSAAALFFSPALAAASLAALLLLFIVRFALSPVRDAARFRFIVWYSLFCSFWFTYGLLYSLRAKTVSRG